MDLRSEREALRRELEAIREEHGKLTAELVVEEARSARHPLHNRFEWDNKIAGHKYRLAQARRLIATVRVPFVSSTGDIEKVRAYHSVNGRDMAREYRPVDEVVEDEFLTKIVLRDMERDWRALHRRYGKFAEFVELVRSDLGEPGEQAV